MTCPGKPLPPLRHQRGVRVGHWTDRRSGRRTDQELVYEFPYTPEPEAVEC